MHEIKKTGPQVQCTVSRGDFDFERWVSIELPGETRVGNLVDKSQVLYSGDLEEGKGVAGLVSVRLVSGLANGSVIIEIPGQDSKRVEVPAHLLQWDASDRENIQ